jgi:hypothetical protein
MKAPAGTAGAFLFTTNNVLVDKPSRLHALEDRSKLKPEPHGSVPIYIQNE